MGALRFGSFLLSLIGLYESDFCCFLEADQAGADDGVTDENPNNDNGSTLAASCKGGIEVAY